ncbi:MAG: alpha/beta hydrolase [Actinobacteria bacterium]|nr:alpha/beta hydrolase [Actinomycetota bacterium]
MARGRRFLVQTAGAALRFAAAGAVAVGRSHRGPEDHDGELLGSARGTPRTIAGPLGSALYVETFSGESDASPTSGSAARSPASGTASGTLVFTHGWCVNEAIWHHQKQGLRNGSRPFDLVTWDLPGHGHSAALPAGGLTLERGVESLARVIDECVKTDAVLVGHSLGGVLTLAYVLDNPETARRRIRGLVLVGTPLVHFARSVAGRWPGSSLEARAVSQAMQLLVQNSAVDRWFAREVGSRSPRAASYRLIRIGFGPRPDPAHIRFVRDMAAAVPPAVRADTFRAMTGFDFRPSLPRVRHPVLMAVGTRDRLVNPVESRARAALFPRVQVEEFADAGHALFLERHEEFNEAVRRFASRRLAARNGRTGEVRRAPGGARAG